MNAFWTIGGFLAVAVAATALALLFVLPRLMRSPRDRAAPVAHRELNLAVYRDQLKDLQAERAQAGMTPERFDADQLELHARAAEDALAPEDAVPPAKPSRRLGLALAGLLPVAAFGLYFWLGNPEVLTAIAGGGGPASTAAAGNGAAGNADIAQVVQQIEDRTRSHPTDAAAWEALGMARGLLDRWPDAVQAWEQAHRLTPDKPSVLIGYAEALAMASNQVLSGRPIEMIRQALQAEPDNRKALHLAGIHAHQTGDFAQAVVLLDRLAQQLGPDTPQARDVLALRDDAQRRAQGGGPVPVASAAPAAPALPPAAATDATAPAPAATAAAPARISGEVDVSEALRGRIPPQATVYVLARTAAGGPPLAAQRLPIGPMPLRFSLDDSLAMVPGNTLSQHREVTLVARISASGNPIAQPGDLEGRVTGVAVGAGGVRVVVDGVVR